MFTILGSIIAFLIVFGLLILIHECGHFLAAKFFNVKVEEFGIGLPPKAMRLWKKGETEYTLNWLPLGGFVRLYGESDPTGKLKKDPRSFAAQKVWKRIIIAGAGVFMNFVLAYVLLVIAFSLGMKPLSILPDDSIPFSSKESYIITSLSFAEKNHIITRNPDFVAEEVVLKDVSKDSQAEKAGFTKGDSLLKINDSTWKDFPEFYSKVKAIKTTEVTAFLVKQTNGKEKTITITKAEGPFGFQFKQTDPYVSSITNKPMTSMDDIPTYKIPLLDVPLLAGKELFTITSYTFEGVGTLVSSIVQKFAIPKDIGGPVQIAEVVHNVNVQAGIPALILLMIILSINLGVINILPIPALDGGRILFMLIELCGKRISEKLETKVHFIGYGLLLVLLLVITAHDILRIFS